MRTFKLFAEERFDDLKEQRLGEMRRMVQAEQGETLLTADEEEYAGRLVARFALKPLVLELDGLYVSSKEVSVRAEEFPGGGFIFNVQHGRSYQKQAITYHIPVTGDEQLLKCQPNPTVMWSLPVYLADRALSFDIVDFYGDAEKIKSAADETLGLIRTQYGNLSKNIEAYNSALPREVRAAVAARREQVVKQNNLVASLGLPVKKSGPDGSA